MLLSASYLFKHTLMKTTVLTIAYVIDISSWMVFTLFGFQTYNLLRIINMVLVTQFHTILF